VINTICDAALVHGFADEKTILDSKVVTGVLQEKAKARRAYSKTAVNSTGHFTPVVLGENRQGNVEPIQPIDQKSAFDDKSSRKLTEFNRDSARLLFKKYYHDS
ncbi:MAG: hypothetical protein P8163_15490, partial [Candidatus Thiodiazotropha sp.]